MKKGIISLLTATLITACAGSPMRISFMSDQEIKAERSGNLCNAYALNRSDRVRAELIRRNEITDEEWKVIDNKKIRIGISELALVCSWGAPTRINNQASRHGSSKQYVYRQGYSGRGQFVYIRQGKVSSWQG
ncbi:MAG: hypothetical protein OEY11_12215 [Gammaproteobacteria bacterium]|nr:hypothetical protein [Gammaproteobacteria bacterium]